LTDRALTATAFFAIAGTLSAGAALVAVRLLRRRPWSARMAAALFLLLTGSPGLAALFMSLLNLLTRHDILQVPIKISLLILGISGAGALYNILAIAAPMMLPLALPLVALFALAIARKPR
jgi:hypothetical protein